MPMFWSKKSKSEKPAKAAKSAPAKAAPGQAKALKLPKEAKPAKKAVAVAVAPAAAPSGALGASASAIIRPHITEKSGLLAQGGVYTFQVEARANKEAISKAVNALYKVNPVKVAIINLPAKSVFVKGRRGTISAIRKAMVTVKKGDKIDFI